MTTVSTTIRIDKTVKDLSKKKASRMWLNLSQVISLFLKDTFLESDRISVQHVDKAGFTREKSNDLRRLIEEAEKWIGVSKPYTNVEDLIRDLDNNAVKY